MGDRFVQVAALIAQEPAVRDGHAMSAEMQRLCRALTRAVQARGAGVTVMTADGMRGVTAASDPGTEHLEELQFTTGEGPCVDAYAQQRPVLVADVADGAMARWPGYAPVVYAAGVRAVFAFPLQVGAARLGILDIFRTEPGMLATDDLTLALTFADVATATLLNGNHGASPGPGDGWWGEDGSGDTLGSRSELFQAQGMVMVQLGGNLADAMIRIRAHAYAHDRPILEVAADIVARRLRFDPQT